MAVEFTVPSPVGILFRYLLVIYIHVFLLGWSSNYRNEDAIGECVEELEVESVDEKDLDLSSELSTEKVLRIYASSRVLAIFNRLGWRNRQIAVHEVYRWLEVLPQVTNVQIPHWYLMASSWRDYECQLHKYVDASK